MLRMRDTRLPGRKYLNKCIGLEKGYNSSNCHGSRNFLRVLILFLLDCLFHLRLSGQCDISSLDFARCGAISVSRVEFEEALRREEQKRRKESAILRLCLQNRQVDSPVMPVTKCLLWMA